MYTPLVLKYTYALLYILCLASGVFVNYTLFLYSVYNIIVNMQYATMQYNSIKVRSSRTYVPAHGQCLLQMHALHSLHSHHDQGHTQKFGAGGATNRKTAYSSSYGGGREDPSSQGFIKVQRGRVPSSPPPPPPQIVIPTCSTSILDVILHCSSVRTLAHNLGNIWLVELGILQCSLWRVQTINFRGTVAGEFEKKRNQQYSCASECVVGGGGGGEGGL